MVKPIDLHIMGVLEIHTFRCEKLVDPDVIQFLHAVFLCIGGQYSADPVRKRNLRTKGTV